MFLFRLCSFLFLFFVSQRLWFLLLCECTFSTMDVILTLIGLKMIRDGTYQPLNTALFRTGMAVHVMVGTYYLPSSRFWLVLFGHHVLHFRTKKRIGNIIVVQCFYVACR